MNGTSIGIKVADGSFYPVLEEEFKGRKKLILTTVRDNQSTVQIDLYKGKAVQTKYVGSLIIENIQAAPKGEPEIEVVLGMDKDGNLNAIASDMFTGEKQSLSVSLQSISEEGLYEVPEFDIEEDLAAAAEQPGGEEGFEETLLTGESYPLGAKDRRKEHLEKRRRNPLLLIGFVLLCLLIIAGIGFLIFRSINGPVPPPLSGDDVSMTEETPAPAAQESGPAEEPAPPDEKIKIPSSITYEIKKGDTLWDLASTFYRNPWLYPKIGRANGIANPDIIFAGHKIVIPEN